MSGLTGELLLSIGVAAIGLGSGWATGRRSRRTEAAQATIEAGKLELSGFRAEGEAAERAQRISEKIIDSLREEVLRLEAIIDRLRDDLSKERERNVRLEGRIRDLEDTATSMRRLLKDAGVEYPPKTPAEA